MKARISTWAIVAVVVVIVVVAVSLAWVFWPSLAGPRPGEELKVKTLKVPTVGPGETPIVTIVLENPTGKGVTTSYTLEVDGNAVETKTITVAAGETKAVPFELAPFAAAGTHDIDVAGMSETLSVDASITLVWDPAKLYHSFVGFESFGPVVEPISFSELEAMITPEVKEAIRQKGFTSAFTVHNVGESCGIIFSKVYREAEEEFNMDLLTVASADWDTTKEIANVESIIALHPDILFVMTTDPEATSDLYREVVDAGIHIVYTDMCSKDHSRGDYVGIVTCDYAGYGLAAGEEMVRMLRESTKEPPYEILQFYMGITFHPVTVRDKIFEEYVNQRPDLVLIKEGFTDPTTEVFDKTETLLPKHPGLDAIYAPWDMPALSAMEAALGMGRKDIIYGASDISKEIALKIADPAAPCVALGTSSFVQQARAQVYLAVLDQLGYDVPPVVCIPGYKVTRDSLLEMYRTLWAEPLGEEIPEEITQGLQQEKPLP